MAEVSGSPASRTPSTVRREGPPCSSRTDAYGCRIWRTGKGEPGRTVPLVHVGRQDGRLPLLAGKEGGDTRNDIVVASRGDFDWDLKQGEGRRRTDQPGQICLPC